MNRPAVSPRCELRFAAILWAAAIAAGCATGVSLHGARAGDDQRASAAPGEIRLAQRRDRGNAVDVCRDVFGLADKVFRPRHPLSDNYGCVATRDLEERRPERSERPEAREQRPPVARNVLVKAEGEVRDRWESGWVADNNRSSHVTTFRHNLGRLPSVVTLWFRPPGDGQAAYPVAWQHVVRVSGNPLGVEITKDRINLHINPNIPLRGIYTVELSWQQFNEGFWKVVVLE